MAEENTTTESTTQGSPPTLDEAKIANMVKESASSAVREALAALQQQSTPQVPVEAEEPDYFTGLIDARVGNRMAQLGLQAEAADDRADFYSSDFWLEDIDELLTSDTPEAIKEEKRELRKKIEASFSHLAKSGRGLRREEIAKHAIGENLVEKRGKYEDKVVKKRSSRDSTELEKAKAAVNIAGNAVSDFHAQDVYGMDYDKVVEKFGSLTF